MLYTNVLCGRLMALACHASCYSGQIFHLKIIFWQNVVLLVNAQTQNKNSELMSTPTCTLQTTHTDLKQNRQANNRQIKITAKQQPTNYYNFHVLTTNHITKKLTNPNQDQLGINTNI